MPDYGEIFCEAVDKIANNKLANLSYDYTQVCEIIDNSKRSNGIYRVQIGQSKFQAFSSTTTYEVGDIVYVITPNNNVDEQRIILAKKQTNIQEPITHIKPFNSFIKLTENLVDKLYEKSLLANNKNQEKILIWSSDRSTLYAGYTRLGLSGLFQSSVVEAINGTYGLEIRLYAGENQELIKTLNLSSKDMYGNPYDFKGYYIQQKLFDISDLPAFDKIEMYFYQDNNFNDLMGKEIPYKDNIGLLSPNLFVSNPEIYLGYDTSDDFNEGIILYTPNSIYYGKDSKEKKIKWRYVKVYNDKSYELIEDFYKLPYGYKINFYKYNTNAKYSSIAGANWELLGTNIEIEPLEPNQTVANYKYKAIVVSNNKVIYESNTLEFINTLDVVGEKINKYSNNFHIELEDNNLNGEYYIYENGTLTIKNNNKYAYPAFRNDKNEVEYIMDIEKIKWIVPMNKTMINLTLPKNPQEILLIENDLGNQSLEDYLDDLTEDEETKFKREDFKYVQYKDNYYVYSYKPQNINDQRITYTLKETLDTNLTNNSIKCYITHDTYNLESERALIFGETSMAPNPYRLELSFSEPETSGFFAEENTDIKKEIVANIYDIYGNKIELYDKKDVLKEKYNNFKIIWSWYEPDPKEDYKILFDIDDKTARPYERINVHFKEAITSVQEHYSIILAELIVGEEKVAEAFFPIPLYKNNTVTVSNVISQIQSGSQYNNVIAGEYEDESKEIKQLIAEFLSSFGEDDIYMPQLENGILIDIPVEIENLKALYSYGFKNEIGELLAIIPALRKSNFEYYDKRLPIGLPVESSEPEQQAYSLKRSVDKQYPYEIIKSDLSSGTLLRKAEGSNDSWYNGIVVGKVQKENSTPKYGIYGFKEDKMTFSVDENGDAYFGGTLEGASGSFTGDISGASGKFSGSLNATDGNIGGWYITQNGLADESGTIELKPGKDGGKPGIWIGKFFFNDETLIGDSLTVDGINVGPAIADLRSTDVTVNKALSVLDTELQAVEDIIYKESTPPSWSAEGTFIPGNKIPSWQEIEFITDINFDNKTFTKKKIKVLATGAPVDVN